MPDYDKTYRIRYSFVIGITIIAGLSVRYFNSCFPELVNLYLGDILYAFMMFYIFSYISPGSLLYRRAFIALVICYLIELLQFYKAPWLTEIRQTLPGRLILGSGFLWSDLLAYLLGVAAAASTDKFWRYKPKIRD